MGELESRIEYLSHGEIGYIRLEEIDESLGYTVVHNIHTGEYQIHPDSFKGRLEEYRRSVLTHVAALGICFYDQADQALEYMARLEDVGDIFEVLREAEKVWHLIPSDCISEYWYYLENRIAAAFYADEYFFESRQFTEHFGKSLEFDDLLVRIMIFLYSQKILQLKRTIEECTFEKREAKRRRCE